MLNFPFCLHKFDVTTIASTQSEAAFLPPPPEAELDEDEGKESNVRPRSLIIDKLEYCSLRQL